MENRPSAGIYTCSPIPTASALSPSPCSHSTLTPHIHTLPSMWAKLQLASESQDPQCLPSPLLHALPYVFTTTHLHCLLLFRIPRNSLYHCCYLCSIFTQFCSTGSLCGPRNICPVGTLIRHSLSSSSLSLTSKENHLLQIISLQFIWLSGGLVSGVPAWFSH